MSLRAALLQIIDRFILCKFRFQYVVKKYSARTSYYEIDFALGP